MIGGFTVAVEEECRPNEGFKLFECGVLRNRCRLEIGIPHDQTHADSDVEQVVIQFAQNVVVYSHRTKNYFLLLYSVVMFKNGSEPTRAQQRPFTVKDSWHIRIH